MLPCFVRDTRVNQAIDEGSQLSALYRLSEPWELFFWGGGGLGVESDFMWTFPGNQDAAVK